MGGTVTRTALPTGKTLAEVVQAAKSIVGPKAEVFAYVNATGLGAKELVGDNTIFPLRSHSIYIKGESDEITDRLDVGAVNTIVATADSAVPITYTIVRILGVTHILIVKAPSKPLGTVKLMMPHNYSLLEAKYI